MVPGPVGGETRSREIPRNPWIDNFFRPVLIVAMIMCLSLSLVNLVRLINPAWRGTYFLIGMLLTTTEAIFSYRLLRLHRLRGLVILRYRLAEAVVLALVLKLLSFADKPLAWLWAELLLLWQDPLNFINVEFYILLVLAMAAWLAATDTAADFEELYMPAHLSSAETSPLHSLTTRFYWGGGILVLISGVTQWLARAGLSSLIDFRRPSLGGVILNVLVYFALGLVLLSQAHLTRLLVRWQLQRVTVVPNLARQWARYGLILLALVGLLAFGLPTRYSLGFLESAGFLVQLVLGWLIFVLHLIFLLLLLPIAWLLSLFGREMALRPVGPSSPASIPGTEPGAVMPPWLEIIRSFIFWLVIAAIAWYLVRVYLSDHPELLQGLRRFRLLDRLFHLLVMGWRWLTGLAQSGWDRLPKRVRWPEQGSRLGRGNFRRWAGLGGLTPREKVLYYYLNILEQVRRRGTARRSHQTPYEFEPELSRAVPEAEQEVQILTQAFVQARYSRQVFDDTQASLARALWQRIRQALSRPLAPHPVPDRNLDAVAGRKDNHADDEQP